MIPMPLFIAAAIADYKSRHHHSAPLLATAADAAAAYEYNRSAPRPWPKYVPTGQLMTSAWRPIPRELTSRRVISIGLPKTGTTSTGWALVGAGLRVAKGQGDIFSKTCQAIICCVESYEELTHKWPGAQWVVTYGSNFTSWASSIRRYYTTINKLFVGATHMPCMIFACEMGLDAELRLELSRRNVSVGQLIPLDAHTHWLRAEHRPLLERAYRTYYARLFTWLDSHSIRYAVVDVRANKYTGIHHFGLNISTPFGTFNAMDHSSTLIGIGHSFVRKPTCCMSHDPWKSDCPEEQLARSDKWAYCPRRELYVPVPRDDETRAHYAATCSPGLAPSRSGGGVVGDDP